MRMGIANVWAGLAAFGPWRVKRRGRRWGNRSEPKHVQERMIEAARVRRERRAERRREMDAYARLRNPCV